MNQSTTPREPILRGVVISSPARNKVIKQIVFWAAPIFFVGSTDAQLPLSQSPSWPDPVANHVVPRQSTPVTHGPILGDVTANSIRIWVRGDSEFQFDVILQQDRTPFDDPIVGQGRTNKDEDFTGFVQVDGLTPHTRYAWAVRVAGEIIDPRGSFRDPWPTFTTLPDRDSFKHKFNPSGKFNFSFSIGACQRQRSPGKTYGIYPNPPAFDTIWDRHRHQISFHIVNGDYTYEETLDGGPSGIENNYKLYLNRGRSLNRLLHHVPLVTMYNDHEVTDNIDGSGEVGLRDGSYLVRDPALRVWQYYADWANGDAPQKTRIRGGQANLEKDSEILHDPDAAFDDLRLSQISTLHIGSYFKGAKNPVPATTWWREHWRLFGPGGY